MPSQLLKLHPVLLRAKGGRMQQTDSHSRCVHVDNHTSLYSLYPLSFVLYFIFICSLCFPYRVRLRPCGLVAIFLLFVRLSCSRIGLEREQSLLHSLHELCTLSLKIIHTFTQSFRFVQLSPLRVRSSYNTDDDDGHAW